MKEQIWAVAYSTYRSIFRYKVLWLAPIIFATFAIMAMVFWFMQDTRDVEALLRQMIGNVTGAMGALGFLFALVVGATLISSELDQKTLHPMILKPMPLGAFFTGKFLGAALFYAVCYGALATLLFAISWGVEGKPDFLLLAIYALLILDLCAIIALTMAVAQGVRTPLAAGAAVFFMSFIANGSEQIRDILIHDGGKVPAWFLNGLSVFLEIIRWAALAENEFSVMDDHVSRGALLWERLAWVIPYGLVYCAAAVAVGSFYFSRYNRFRA